MISDGLEDECTETNFPEQKEKGVRGNNRRVIQKPKIQCLKMKEIVRHTIYIDQVK